MRLGKRANQCGRVAIACADVEGRDSMYCTVDKVTEEKSLFSLQWDGGGTGRKEVWTNHQVQKHVPIISTDLVPIILTLSR